MTTRDTDRTGIFISYRRSDSGGYAGRLGDSLQAALGHRARVFMDVDTIDAGVDFVNALDDAVAQCQVFYALIGPLWLDVRDDQGERRLDVATDWVRREIATALSRDDVRVVPVLVGGATLPVPEALPQDLQALVRRQAFELHASNWRSDVEELVAQTVGVRPRRPRGKLMFGAVTLLAIAAVIAGLLLAGIGADNGRATPVESSTTVAGGQRTAAADATDSDPRAQIVKLTGGWSVKGFVEAIAERDTDIVAKYLKSGMKATTQDKGASAILYGFQGDWNNDPVALLKTFQANGYKLDEELIDGRILVDEQGNSPFRFDTPLTPKNYTGGYQDGKFAGSLLFWIVSRAMWNGASDQNRSVLKYLIAQGADCSVTLSFLDSNRDLFSDYPAFTEFYPMIKSCAG